MKYRVVFKSRVRRDFVFARFLFRGDLEAFVSSRHFREEYHANDVSVEMKCDADKRWEPFVVKP